MAKQVKVIIKNSKGKYLMVKRADKEKIEHCGNWECPGGKLIEGESFEEAALRESKEEVNLDLKLIKIIKRIEKDGDINAIVFLATPLSDEIILSWEHSDYRWFTFEELKKLEPITYKDFFLSLLELTRHSP